ncbi:excitatory amino acid transporter 3-like [Centruroides sculpturatus]|uniref:excitatory amino acid transporter 3-like n=1 Tax=Centruroides sculpturatus TaxID=218467 RepID=UPI000C6E77B2|nr:excitatory amino acid transporter 3-like [Centruroides sculpturatus]
MKLVKRIKSMTFSLPWGRRYHKGFPVGITEMTQTRVKAKEYLRTNLLPILTIICVIIGIVIGLSVRNLRKWDERRLMYINFPAEIFLRMLQALTIPLIVASLIAAVGNLEVNLVGKIGVRAILVFLSTTLIATSLGVVLVSVIQPGKHKEDTYVKEQNSVIHFSLTVDKLLDLVRNMIPRNIIEACIFQTFTEIVPPENETLRNSTEIHSWKFKSSRIQEMNILGLVVFAIMIGMCLSKMKEKSKPALNFFECIDECIMIIAEHFIWFSPMAVMFIIIGKIVETENVMLIVEQLGSYVLTVLLGLFIHSMLILPCLYFVFTRMNPFTFMRGMLHAIITALITASSSATLPITIKCLKNKIGLDPRICSFCLPIGATINMDGLALAQPIAALFIAQIKNIEIDSGGIIAVVVMSAASSVAAAGIPNSGMITLVMVLQALNLPAENVAIVFVIDWFLDRFQTVVNVLGDAYGSAIVANICQEELEEISVSDYIEDELDHKKIHREELSTGYSTPSYAKDDEIEDLPTDKAMGSSK